MDKNVALATLLSNQSEVPVLVEWRDGFKSEETVSACAARLDHLADTLSKMHYVPNHGEDTASQLAGGARSINFSILSCLGWVSPSPSLSRIGLVFKFPHSDLRPPVSLHSLLKHCRKAGLDPPALGTRFDVAYGLARSLANLIVVGWLHKAFRSHNVLTFDERRFTDVYLSGFSYARPGRAGNADLSTLPCEDLEFILYRPSRTLKKELPLIDEVNHGISGKESDGSGEKSRVTAAFDIFGLGIVLLEIGHWRTIDSMRSDVPNHEFLDSSRFTKIVNNLGYRVGDIYRDVVRKCLGLEGWAGEADIERKFLQDVICKLAQCKA
jgi:hypothetical protein